MIIPCILYMFSYLFLLADYKWHCSVSYSTSQPIDMSQSLCIPFFFCSCKTMSSREIKEWIMENMWDIKRVSESQGDAEKAKEISFPTKPVLWSSKIWVAYSHRNKIVFQNLPTNVGHILSKLNMFGQRLGQVYGDWCKYMMVSDMFDQTKIAGKFMQKPLMHSLLFFLSKYFGKRFTYMKTLSGIMKVA
jgi:hypothetical protein